MVISTVTNMERNLALNRLLNDRSTAGNVKLVTPLREANTRDAEVNFPGHVPVKRLSSCPSSQHLRALPKRTRLVATSGVGHCVVTPSNASFQSTACATGVFSTPSSTRPAKKGLSFAPVNGTRQTATNCCTKENMCFGTLSSVATATTPPYGSYNNFQNPLTTNTTTKHGRRKTRQLLRKSRKKALPYNADVISNTKVDRSEVVKRADSLKSQPNALIMYNSFLRQLETESQVKKEVKIPQKDELNQSTGYNRGFTPTLTSTPQHKPHSVISQSPRCGGPVTSDYYSGSGSGSGKSTDLEDSFNDFLQFIEEGVLAAYQKELFERKKQGGSPRKRTTEHQGDNRSLADRRRSADSTPRFASAADSHVTPSQGVQKTWKYLPRMDHIGAPLAASTPVTLPCPSLAPSGSFEAPGGDMWRPWC